MRRLRALDDRDLTPCADISLAINLSAKQLGEPELAADMAAIADKAGVPHDRIEFELTESSVMTDPAGRAAHPGGPARAADSG